MGAQVTPDWQIIYVPDGIFGSPAPSPPPGMDTAPLPVVSSGLDPSILAGLGLSDPGLPSSPPPAPPPIGAPELPEPSPPPAIPAQSTPDVIVTPQQKKQAGAAVQKERAAEAFSATPEGQIQQAGQGAVGAIAEQGQIAGAMGDIEASKQDEIQQLRARTAADMNTDQAAREKARARRLELMASKQREVDGLVKAEADYKVDDSKFWKERSGAQKFAALLSIALSGIGEALAGRGGKNPALDLMRSMMEDNVRAQIRERDQLGKRIGIARSSIDTYRQAGADEEEVFRFKMAEDLERKAREAEVIAGKYAAPEAKARALATAAQFRQMGAEYAGKLAEGRAERSFREEQAAFQNQMARSAEARGWAGHALNRAQFEWQKEFQNKSLEQAAAKAAAEGNAEEAKLIRERGIGGQAVPTRDDKGNIVGERQDLLRNRDGSIFVPAGSVASVDKLRDAKASSDTLVSLLEEARRIRTGWTSDSAKSPEFQQLKANWSAAKSVAKDAIGLGALSGPDMELIDGFIGTGDPTQWRDVDAGIAKAINNVSGMMTNKLRAAGFDGEYKAPTPPKEAAGARVPGQDDGALVDLMTDRPYKVTPRNPKGGLEPDRAEILRDIARAASGGDADAEAKLRKIAGGSDDARVRDTARALLSQIRPPTATPVAPAPKSQPVYR